MVHTIFSRKKIFCEKKIFIIVCCISGFICHYLASCIWKKLFRNLDNCFWCYNFALSYDTVSVSVRAVLFSFWDEFEVCHIFNLLCMCERADCVV